MHTISYGEFFWVHGMRRQRRIVAEDVNHELYSIPATYRLKFHLVDAQNRKSDALELNTALRVASDDPKRWGSPPVVVLENNDRAQFVVGNETTQSMKFSKLRLIDVYDELFLAAYAIQGAYVGGDEILLPTYLKARFDIAVGFRHNSDPAKFKDWLRDQTEKIMSTNIEAVDPPSEIIQLQKGVLTTEPKESLGDSSPPEPVYERLSSIHLQVPADFEDDSLTHGGYTKLLVKRVDGGGRRGSLPSLQPSVYATVPDIRQPAEDPFPSGSSSVRPPPVPPRPVKFPSHLQTTQKAGRPRRASEAQLSPSSEMTTTTTQQWNAADIMAALSLEAATIGRSKNPTVVAGSAQHQFARPVKARTAPSTLVTAGLN
jgi:hypothetical protein